MHGVHAWLACMARLRCFLGRELGPAFAGHFGVLTVGPAPAPRLMIGLVPGAAFG